MRVSEHPELACGDILHQPGDSALGQALRSRKPDSYATTAVSANVVTGK